MIARWLVTSLACLLPFAAAFGASPTQTLRASTEQLTAAQQERMRGRSWHDGCPVPMSDLVRIRLTYLGYDGASHDGTLIVHRRVAKEVTAIFQQLFDAGFRIERLEPYENFPVGEYAASNDSVGFYCRPAQDAPTNFSWHAYGLAIDLNPLTNPFLDPKAGWWPAGSSANSARNTAVPGLLTSTSVAVGIFMAHGWAWGGVGSEHPDYMHFGKVTIGGEDDPLQRPVWAERLGPATE